MNKTGPGLAHEQERTGGHLLKRIARVVLPAVVAVMVLAVPGPVAAQIEPTCGDVNGTGEITAADALVLLRRSVGQPVELACPAPGVLARTGQSLCWNSSGNEIPCNGSGQDGETRAGQPVSFTDNGDGTITDNVTGLMWEKLSRNGSVHEVSESYDWNSAFEKIGALNDDSFAGYTDWRLPNQRELFSLLTFGGAAEQTISAVFRTDCQAGCAVTTCSCTSAARYWSATTDPFASSSAEGVDFGDAATFSATKGSDRHVRAVRTAGR